MTGGPNLPQEGGGGTFQFSTEDSAVLDTGRTDFLWLTEGNAGVGCRQMRV